MVVLEHIFQAPWHIFAYIWGLSADQVQEIGSYRSFESVPLWHMDADENVLVVFEIDWKKCPLEVQQTQWMLTGLLLQRKNFSLPLLSRSFERYPQPRKSRTFGNKTITRLHTEDDQHLDLVYDCTIDNLSVRWIDNPVPVHYLPRFRNRLELLTPYISY